MRRTVFLVLCLVGTLLSGCKEAEILGGIAQNVGLQIGGTRAGDLAESAVKGGAAVAHSMEDFTPEQEYYIGRAVTAELLSRYRPLNNKAANDYVNLLGQSLALFSDLPLTYGGYHVQIVDSNEINAFAAPGGFILLTRGLMRCCSDETALAAVLAHEIAHVQHKDALRAIRKSRITAALGVLGGEAVKHLGGADLARLTDIFSDSIGDIMTAMVDNGYSRAYEYEADQAAVTILTRAGYDPGGLVRMLGTMDTRLGPGSGGFARTHPAPGDRIAKLSSVTKGPHYADNAARTSRFTRAMKAL